MVEDNSKINVGIHIAPHQESSSIEIATEASFKSSDLSSRSGGSAPTQLWSFHEMQRRTTMRIRISNEISERSKDMVVDIRPSLSVYAAIYDSKSVRDAHVRKWGPEIVQKVKNGTAEIQCAVWDEVVGKPCHTFSLDELKHISTKKLHDLVPESVRVKLVLRCLDKEMESEKKTVDSPSIHPSLSSRTASSISRCPFSGMEISADLLEQFTDHILAQRNEDEKSQSSQESSSDEDETSSPTHFPNLDESRRPVTNTKLNEESYNDSFTNTAKSVSTVGESFAEDAPSVINVRVTNQVSQRTRDLLLPLVDQKSLFEAVYENPALKEGHVRKWSSEIAKQVKSGTAEIQLVLQRNTKTVQFFTLEHLKMISTAQFYHMLVKERIKTTEIVHLELRCATKDAYQDDIADLSVAALESSMRSEIPSSMNQDKSDNDDDDDQDHISELHFASSHIRQDSVPLELLSGITRSLTDPSIGDTLLSLDLDLDHVSGIVPMVQKQTLRIRISNRTSHRFKDLVVDINDNLNLYDAIYDNKGVKDAHVRKWGPQMVQDVKRGMVEVQVVVWDDDAARPWRVFKVDELKTTTTRDLYESVPESCDLVKLFLECVRTKQIAHSIRLENGKPQSVIPPTSMRHCKSESCLKKGTSRRTTTRLNHMNLSGMSYGSNSSTLSDRRTGSLSNEFWNKLASVSDHNRQAGRPPRRKDQSQHIDIDAYLMRSKKISDRRSLSTADVRGNVNQAWSKRTNKSNPNEDVTLSAKVQRFLELSERRFNQRIQASESSQSFSTSQSSDLLSQDQDPQITYEDKIKEFMRLCNAKKTASLQSMKTSQRAPRRSLQNETFPTIVQTRTEMDNPFLSRVSSITLQDRRASAPPLRGIPNASFLEYGLDMSGTSGSLRAGDVHVPTTDTTSGKVIDRINRFLRLSEADQKAPFEHVFHKPISTSESMLSMRSSLESLKGDGLIATSMTIIDDPTKKSDVTLDAHPIAEIEVSKSDEEILPVRAGVSLSSDLVKEVFPYHLVLNSEFRILQIGNNLAQFIDEDTLIGRTVSDILMVASPIPMFGKWDWNIMDKMKDKTIFLESLSNSYNTKVKIKGTMIEISSSPRTVMLALFPNVKNLSELEDMNLSIADLPLHSCQREAVLLGEHSKSEVKLTNHLDQLHRELINSMEKQIEDRTNELAMANLDLERANSQLAIQSARQLEHFACMSHEIRTPLNCIVGMSSLLLDDADEMDPMHADSIRMINTSGDLLKAVVDDVLDYAKLESGSFEVDIKPTNLQETLASVVHSISQRVQEKNIRLRTHYSPTLPLVLETDSRRLQQVLFNLLGNASKCSLLDIAVQ